MELMPSPYDAKAVCRTLCKQAMERFRRERLGFALANTGSLVLQADRVGRDVLPLVQPVQDSLAFLATEFPKGSPTGVAMGDL